MRFNSFQFSVFSFKKFTSLKQKTLLILSLLVTLYSFGQYNIPEKPSDKDQKFVYDYANLLPVYNKEQLETKLKHYTDTTSTQIVIAVINSTKGEDINYLGAQWGHKWGIGQKKEDNGVLILLARNDRKIAISNGYGVEHILTDALCKQIIENDIIPYFKQSDYYGGLNRGVDAIIEALKGEYKAKQKPKENKGIPRIVIIIFIIFIIIMIRNRGGKGGRGSGPWIGSYGSGGFGGGSFGGGGSFSSGGFGGGGFGGGGASGGW